MNYLLILRLYLSVYDNTFFAHGDDIFNMQRTYALVFCSIKKNGFLLIHPSSVFSWTSLVFACLKGLGYCLWRPQGLALLIHNHRLPLDCFSHSLCNSLFYNWPFVLLLVLYLMLLSKVFVYFVLPCNFIWSLFLFSLVDT